MTRWQGSNHHRFCFWKFFFKQWEAERAQDTVGWYGVMRSWMYRWPRQCRDLHASSKPFSSLFYLQPMQACWNSYDVVLALALGHNSGGIVLDILWFLQQVHVGMPYTNPFTWATFDKINAWIGLVVVSLLRLLKWTIVHIYGNNMICMWSAPAPSYWQFCQK